VISHIIVGLGNPEGKYFKTWHNLGFVTVEKIADEHNLEFKKKGNQMTASFTADQEKKSFAHSAVLLLKPLTYMNNSGQAVVALCRKHKIAPENVIVICDDLHIERGNIRVAFGGSAGGHNGLKSITELLQTDKYFRVRIGAKPCGGNDSPHTPRNMANYVLSKITEQEQAIIRTAIDNAAAAAVEIANGAPLAAIQQKYNAKNPPKEENK
jgi:PTH1 family peptidyl-tRNA hydrolase